MFCCWCFKISRWNTLTRIFFHSLDWAPGRTFPSGGFCSSASGNSPVLTFSSLSFISGTPINYKMLEGLDWLSHFNFNVILIPGLFSCISLLSGGILFFCRSLLHLSLWPQCLWLRVLNISEFHWRWRLFLLPDFCFGVISEKRREQKSLCFASLKLFGCIFFF